MHPIVVNDYDELKKLLGVLGTEAKFVYFRGNDLETGLSWCPDCQKSDETVKTKLNESSLQTIICNVGFKETWKDEKNPFKTDEKLNVGSIPTLLNFTTNERITDENELAKADVVGAFLSNKSG
ncbi:Thioredoxin domain-containing protein 17 isoform X2 [Aphelenchoides bicaudatus]|nr:Thioredoxin domain-containing protein 17 isoform X2 [Aphelenchoides bicaudatus]